MLRVGVEDLVLQILLLDLGEPTYFLSRALNPPSHLAMSNSLKLLETLGAVECHLHKAPCLAGQDNRNEGPPRDKTCGDLDIQCEMTALGFHLGRLYLHVSPG
jgi:ATP-dependent RNA helicase DHX36